MSRSSNVVAFPRRGDDDDAGPFDQDEHDATAADAAAGVDVDQDEDDGDVDAESIAVVAETLGRPVDPPDVPVSGSRRAVERARAARPVLPAWARSRAAARNEVAWVWRSVRYWAGYHGVRVPKYAGKTIYFAPVGLLRTIGRLGRWARAEQHNWELRQYAADHNDPDTWMRLDARRARQARARWLLVTAAFLAAGGVAALLVFATVPAWWRLVALAIAVPSLARAGRPADRPITDWVRNSKAYRKLTAELVRQGLLSTQVKALNAAVARDPKAISFPQEIHRDGPGHLAVVDLPLGVEASDIVARRGRLASGLRLPLDQVWPEPGQGHPGRLALWVGHEPASQMRQPAWPLIAGGEVDVFKAFPFATTPRLETVMAELMYRNWLFGGQPGSGKTFALRTLALAAALDPRVELRGYNLKGSGDFNVLEPVCVEYGNGFDDDTIGACAALFRWLYAECRRRAERVDHYARLGKAPENKVTPELASLKGSGLHPMVVFVDEIQELFLHKEFGKKAGELAEKAIKLARAFGIILLMGTQIPDKDSLPTGITRNVNTRYCLSVADQVANDMILGTSAYKLGYRATVFQPVIEAGWGILSGLGPIGARRSFYVNNADAEKVMARAIAIRQGAGVLPNPDAQTRREGSFDLLADLAQVWPLGEDRVWNETLLERLAQLRPDAYRAWRPEGLTSALKPHGVGVGQIGRRIEGKATTRRGPAHDDILDAITKRNRERVGD